MNTYAYIARDFSGARREGHKQAASSTGVLNWLREQGFTPVSVNQISGDVKQTRRTLRRKRIKSSDLSTLCWQLSTMVEGGVPVTTALETIARDIENVYLQQVLQQVLEEIQQGGTLSDGISKFPKIFNQLFYGMMLAGETGGTLSASLRKLAEYYDNRDRLAKKVKGAMAYPAFVFTFIIFIVILIMALIIPRFRVIFEQIGGDLPAFTRAFMQFYDALHHNLVYIIGSFLSLVILGVLAHSKTKKGHYLFCRVALSIPLLGSLLRQAFLVVFCRTMSTLLAAGVSVLEVFDILSAMTRNDIIRAAIMQARDHVVEGSKISLSMAAVGFFPNMVVNMIQAGEESGSLSEVLERTADYYERKVNSTVTTVMNVLEPIMIITVGAIVLVVVLALYLPIFSISNMPR